MNNRQASPGTQTVTITPVLQLHASNNIDQRRTSQARRNRRGVRWEENVIDNENLGRKKTKICCIFHPADEEDEEHEHEHEHPDPSSDSDSSSSSSESDNDKGLDFNERRRRRVERRHKKMEEAKPYEPNAYEFQPDYTHRQQGKENSNLNNGNEKENKG